MKRLSEIERDEVHDTLVGTLRELLMFHVSHSAPHFVHEQSTSDWRGLEDQLHENYPIKGIGVQATRGNLGVVDSFEGGFLYTEEDLYPGEVPAELATYPYPAASAAYTFTILEGLGNALVRIVNPQYFTNRHRQAWHHGVYGDANFKRKSERDKAREAFAKTFDRKRSEVPVYAAKRLAKIKAERNEILHEGYTTPRFDDFYASIIGTICFLYFFLLPGQKQLVVYPYSDYEGTFR